VVDGQGEDEQPGDGRLADLQGHLKVRHWFCARYLASVAAFCGRHQASLSRYH
jgi:hypothetical protein